MQIICVSNSIVLEREYIMKKELILVNTNDQVVGYGDKLPIHKAGLLHRAFSLFIYSKEEKKFLLQKRCKQKYHSGGKWSNSCCSHPYKNETWYESLQRSASDELNLTLDIHKEINCDSIREPKYIDDNLFFAGTFIYYSDYNELSEHEFDYVFIYVMDSDKQNINFNKSEVSAIKWQTLSDIDEWIAKCPNDFSSWFDNALHLVKKSLGSL